MRKQGKRRVTFFATILIICTVCIGITISIQMNEYYEKEIDNPNEIEKNHLYEIDQELFRSKFINSFNNKVIGTYSNVKKVDKNKDIVYSNTIQEKIENKYELNINIPVINIDNDLINTYNEEIKSIFESKIQDVKKGNKEIIYSIDYMGSINNGILSLVIKSTLKEGENSQRLIIKTYNYDIDNKKEVKLEALLRKKELEIKTVENKLEEEIKKQNKEALELQTLGYNVFKRNITEDMFLVEKINTYFIDSEGYLYVIYAYGNNNLTTEMDIVVF